jgi:hypothetical protein
MSTSINTYSGGINQDISPQKVENTFYFLLKDGHVVTEGGLTTGAIENEKGTSLAVTIPDTLPIYKLSFTFNPKTASLTWAPHQIASNDTIWIPVSGSPVHFVPTLTTVEQLYQNMLVWYATEIASGLYAIYKTVENIYIVGLTGTTFTVISGNSSIFTTLEVPVQTGLLICGWATERDEIILYTTNCTSSTPGENGQLESYGQIWKFHFDEITKEILGATTPTMLQASNHLFYNNKLNFSTYNRVKKSITRYESSLFSKTYFTDGYNHLRHFNFNYPNHFTLDPSKLELLSNIEMSVPKLSNILYGGGLISGKYQYCYQLFDTNGTESIISPVSNLIDVTSHDDKVTSSVYYRGNTDTFDCSRAIEIKITDLDVRFDMIRFIALHYGDINSDPAIRILEERSLAGQEMYFVDGGDPGIGTLTVAEFRDIGGRLFVCQTIETKNSKLFVGNIEETYFDLDYDARCFRYRVDSVLGEMTYSNTIVVGEENDDINPYNYLNNDNDLYSRYIYKKGYSVPGGVSSVLGGTGVMTQFSSSDGVPVNVPNVEYTFKKLRMDGDFNDTNKLYIKQDTTVTYTLPSGYVNRSWNNNKSSYISDVYRGYQRDEVYRFGIVFFDKRFRPSFVKWIGDIRMPAMADKDANNTTGFPIAKQDATYLNINQLYVLYPEFTVNIPNSIISQISGFSIVRVKRQSTDRTIMGQGLLSRYYNTTIPPIDTPPDAFVVTANDMYPSLSNLTSIYHFISPEVNFNKNLVLEPSDHFRVEAEVKRNASILETMKFTDTDSIVTTGDVIDWDIEVAAGTADDFREDINSLLIDNAYYEPTLVNEGTCAYGTLSGALGTIFHRNVSTTHCLFVNYRRLRTTQYKGASKTSRANSEYIWCNNYTPVEDMTDNTTYKTAVVDVFGGDTFVGYFDYFRGRVSGDNKVLYFPCESSINVELRHDPCYSRTFAPIIFEFGNSLDPLGLAGGPYETGDLYAYNSAYSRESDVIRFFPKPINFQDDAVYDCRILNSDKRYSSQILDNWTKFRYNNFTEVEQTYGAITKLIDYNNVMHFIQTSGFGAIAIDERITTLDSTGATMILGTGEILGKYGYISKDSGSIHHDSILSAASGLHYFDIRNRKWMLYSTDGKAPLNVIKGLSAFFLNNLTGYIQTIDKPLYDGVYNSGISAIYDLKRERVIMTFLDWKYQSIQGHATPVRERYTFSFNETQKAFEQEHSFYPGLYLYSRDRLMSVNPNNFNEIYIHDTGVYGVYYGEAEVPLEITMVVNPSPYGNNIFTNIEFNSKVEIIGADVYDETITSMQAWDSYQDSGVINLVPDSNIRRRLRTWRMQLPRDNDLYSVTFDAARPYDNRISDRYMFLKLTYQNNNNKRFILHDIVTDYIQKPS